MAIFKCKMCGGDLNISEGITVTECEYCGAKQTLPSVTDENIQALYNRANTLRIKNEFDKAEKIYEKIIEADSSQSEAYWCLILCKYGIEYVDDPTTFKKVPTCHRASFDSIIADDDYKSALQYATIEQKLIYEQQAKEIDRIQKEILALAQKEEKYDVFICYKETDESGKRTQDSVIANDIYYQLKSEGFKVFYAAITLEGKLGSAYEPIIFAALNSAKVMLAIGTRPEYFNAVWVKNEWSRYLKILKKDRTKLLIPCYKDMDPYELPDEFAHLQAQDMSKIGFINDITRGIKKVISKDEPKATVVKETVVTGGNTNTAPLLKRAFMFLEDGDWNSANEYCEKVLDLDPECAEAYLGKLMAELRVETREGLKNCDKPFDNRNNFQKAVRFADENLKKELQGYIDFIINCNLTAAYNDAVKMMNDAVFASQCEDAATKFEALKDFKDSKELVKKCFEKRLEILYNDAIYAMDAAESEEDYKNVAADFEALQDYKDSNELAKECYDKAEEARVLALYNGALSAMNAASSEETYHIAAALFDRLAEYKDSSALANECREKAEGARKDALYNRAISRVKGILFVKTEEHTLELACGEFKSISGWRDADEQLECCLKKIEQIKVQQKQAELEAERIRIEKAAKAKKTKIIAIITTSIVCAVITFVIILNSVIIPNNKYNDAVALMKADEYAKAIEMFEALDGYKNSAEMIDRCKSAINEGEYNKAIALMKEEKYPEAIAIFDQLSGYKDSTVKIKECKEAKLEVKYNNAVNLMNKGQLDEAKTIFQELSNYKDSVEKLGEIRLTKLKANSKNIKVGNYIKLGAYEQDNKKSNGNEDIEWLVLDIKNGKALVISKYALISAPFENNINKKEVTWETCSLRAFLNNTFINSAFSKVEIDAIPTMTVPADKNPSYNTNSGKATQDKIFLLSVAEAKKYFSSDAARKCKPTDYLNALDTYGAKRDGCSWDLRTLGENEDQGTHVDKNGSIHESGGSVHNLYSSCVRPAMWIDLSSVS